MKCRLYSIFRILLLIYIAGVAYLCFGNFNDLPEVRQSLLGLPMDKIVHFCMFFPSPLIGFFAVNKKWLSPGEAFVSMLCICSAACIFAGLTEIVQGMLPYRSEDITDFGADCLSIGICSVIVFILNLFNYKKNAR